MKRQYWIKLWLEILEDEKVSPLPDRVWRRFVEVCLVAAACGEGGSLPELHRIAWYLRLTPEETESDLVELARHGLVDQGVGIWRVPNFAKRQAPKGTGARQRTSRRWREVSQASHTEDTIVGPRRTEEQRTEEQKTEDRGQRTEEERSFGAVIATWEATCGPITATLAEHLDDLTGEAESCRLALPPEAEGARVCGNDWVIEAIREGARASTNGRVSVNFVSSILTRWYRDGYRAAYRSKTQEPKSFAAIRQATAEMEARGGK